MTPQDFSSWTRKDWQDFDAIRNLAMQPTKEELAQQHADYVSRIVEQTKNALSIYGIVFTGDETDFSDLYNEYINGDPNMSEQIGDDVNRSNAIAYRSQFENSLEQFCSFVLSYEN